jgi:hypothetical protein
MAQNVGTLVTAAIRPNDDQDLIASAFQNEIKGGHHGYATMAERDSLIVERREWGMFVTVYNDGISNNGIYRLVYNLSSTNLNDNGNWEAFYTEEEGLTPDMLVIPPTTQVVTGKRNTFTCLVVSTDNTAVIATGITIEPNDDVYPTIELNNHELSVGDGVTTEQCYLAAPGTPAEPRGFNSTSTFGKIQIGDVIYINPSLIGYDTDADDEITIKF